MIVKGALRQRLLVAQPAILPVATNLLKGQSSVLAKLLDQPDISSEFVCHTLLVSLSRGKDTTLALPNRGTRLHTAIPSCRSLRVVAWRVHRPASVAFL